MRCCDTSALAFDNCRIPAENLIGKRGRGLHRRSPSSMAEGSAIAALAVGSLRARWMRASNMPANAGNSTSRSASSRRFSGSWPTWRPASKRRGCSPTVRL